MNKEKMFWLTVIIALLVGASLGALVWTQNARISELNQSVSTLTDDLNTFLSRETAAKRAATVNPPVANPTLDDPLGLPPGMP